MNKLSILSLLSAMILFSCQGPPGPTGRPGQDGLDGVNGEEGYTFEYILDFEGPDYAALLDLPVDFVMYDSDVMLVYLLWEVEQDGTEIWRALPQTLYFQDGMLSYNYDFTKYNASIFLDGTVALNTLHSDWTHDWIARVVVVPAQFVNARTTIDFNNYNEVKEYLNLSDSKLAYPGYTKRPE
ncbi:hypothetical protein [Reichenbachiella ulvae]|uniref:Collagen-like protein n=1 Tax=Reichenbachiella ulvae TaxID=2980104 RepID=A0ABT3CQB7_9BACT|nr:hypothetical protein [Reichenbachiella ulvae]MCV9385857.1 hypothetical protein [Reichenbachiella ulvae]